MNRSPRINISAETRFHEAGHAIGAVVSGIGLDARGIQIETTYDATTYVHELPMSEWTEVGFRSSCHWSHRCGGYAYCGQHERETELEKGGGMAGNGGGF